MGAMYCNYCCETVLRPSCTILYPACFRSCVSPSNCSCHHLFKRLIRHSNATPGEFGSFLPLFKRNPLSVLNFAFVYFPARGAFLYTQARGKTAGYWIRMDVCPLATDNKAIGRTPQASRRVATPRDA